MTGGFLIIYYNNKELGGLYPVGSGTTPSYFSLLGNSSYCKAISLGIGNTGYIFINNGANPNDYSQKILLSGTVAISDVATFYNSIVINEGSIYFTVSGTNRYFIWWNSTGNNLIVGNTSYPVYVQGSQVYLTNVTELELIGSTPHIDFHYNNSSADYTSRIYEYSSGTLQISGNLRVGGTVTSSTSSDARLKENFVLLDRYNEVFDKLKPIGFNYIKENDGIHFGFTTQNVTTALEESGLNANDYALLSTFQQDGETYGSLRYNELIALLVYQVQQLKKELKEIKGEN